MGGSFCEIHRIIQSPLRGWCLKQKKNIKYLEYAIHIFCGCNRPFTCLCGRGTVTVAVAGINGWNKINMAVSIKLTAVFHEKIFLEE